LLVANAQRPANHDGGDAPTYKCQVTQLLQAAPDTLPWRDVSQYVDDVRSGNASMHFAARAFLVGGFNRVQHVSHRLPRQLRFRKGKDWGFIEGRPGTTPTGETGLQAGDWVRIKSKEEIMKTLNEQQLNRGLGFEAEMARFCGRTVRVARRGSGQVSCEASLGPMPGPDGGVSTAPQIGAGLRQPVGPGPGLGGDDPLQITSASISVSMSSRSAGSLMSSRAVRARSRQAVAAAVSPATAAARALAS